MSARVSRHCHGCDSIIEDQDPVYCAADFDGLQKERESEVSAAQKRAEDFEAKARAFDALPEWVIARWNAEVANRPIENVYRRTLDDTWRQVYRYVTGTELSDGTAGPPPAIDWRARAERAELALTALMEAARTSLPFLRSAHSMACSMYEYENGVLPRKTTGTCDCGTAARAGEIQDVIDAAPSLPLSPSAQQAAERLAGV